MPIMNGLDAARRIAPRTVIVMFTLHSSPQLMHSAKSAGIKGVLSKSENSLDNLIDSLKIYLSPEPIT